MNRDEFFSRVDAIGIDRKRIALDRWTEEDAFNLVFSREKWIVFWCELGRGPQGEKRFETESDALEYLLSRLSSLQDIEKNK